MYKYVFMYICTICVPGTLGSQKIASIRLFGTAMWMLGAKPKSTAKGASA